MPGQPSSLCSASCRQRGWVRVGQAVVHAQDGQSHEFVPVSEQKLSCLNRPLQWAHRNLATSTETCRMV